MLSKGDSAENKFNTNQYYWFGGFFQLPLLIQIQTEKWKKLIGFNVFFIYNIILFNL